MREASTIFAYVRKNGCSIANAIIHYSRLNSIKEFEAALICAKDVCHLAREQAEKYKCTGLLSKIEKLDKANKELTLSISEAKLDYEHEPTAYNKKMLQSLLNKKATNQQLIRGYKGRINRSKNNAMLEYYMSIADSLDETNEKLNQEFLKELDAIRSGDVNYNATVEKKTADLLERIGIDFLTLAEPEKAEPDEVVFIFDSSPFKRMKKCMKRDMINARNLLAFYKERLKEAKTDVDRRVCQRHIDEETGTIRNIEMFDFDENRHTAFVDKTIRIMLYRYERRCRYYNPPCPNLREVRISSGLLYIRAYIPPETEPEHYLNSLFLQMDWDYDFGSVSPTKNIPRGHVLIKGTIPLYHFSEKDENEILGFSTTKKLNKDVKKKSKKIAVSPVQEDGDELEDLED